MKYLVDANVLSEPTRPEPHAAVVEWLRENEESFVVDSVILGELRVGILSLPGGRKRAKLEKWLQDLERTIECMPWDATISRRWAQLVVDLRKKGRSLPLFDSMIAATALTHGLTVVTRNVRDFRLTGAEVFDPFV